MYKNKTILIVDDSTTERALIVKMVSELGFNVIEATSGESAVKMAIEFKPDLILMDVIMSGINGFQATKQILSIDYLKDIPIIMCSSKNTENDKNWSIRQGASAYIVKPIIKSELQEKICKLL